MAWKTNVDRIRKKRLRRQNLALWNCERGQMRMIEMMEKESEEEVKPRASGTRENN